MTRKTWILLLISINVYQFSSGQSSKIFTHADTLRGSNTTERSWWDVLKYDITVQPDFNSRTIKGHTSISFKVLTENKEKMMQIDLQDPLIIDSIMMGVQKLAFIKDGAVWHVKTPSFTNKEVHQIDIFYQGKVHEAKTPPWEGGWIWTKDSLGRPWMTVTCQGLGASVWYPCKDYQADEPDNGASLTMIVPDTLIGIGNGRLQSKENNNNGTTSYKWVVLDPISNYCIIPYIGKYINFHEVYKGAKGKLDLNYWVLDYNEQKAKAYMPTEVHNMLKAFEYWMGPYPFYEDGYQLIESSHTGMEHQSAVAYGNWYKSGYRGRDGSGTGWGLKWDFIIVHESGHEWFGNNITTKDLADMWVHEGFTNYSETLFIDYFYGKEAADAYNAGIRRGIRNDRPIIAKYDVNDEGSGDMYTKSSNMLHAIRHGLDNDSLFRSMLIELNKIFYHQTVTTKQIENAVSKCLKFDYQKVFDQYLRTVQIPTFEFYYDALKKTIFYRYTNCIEGFNLPLTLKNGAETLKILPGKTWKERVLAGNELDLFTTSSIEKMYYLNVVKLSEKK